jgi:hypothetical protein
VIRRTLLPSSLLAFLALLPACLDPALRPASSIAAPSAETVSAGERTTESSGELILWTGEPSHDQGAGWASCQNEREGTCRTSLEKEAGAGRDGGAALHFEGQGSEWMGFGWNWFGWWPSHAGTDISDRKTFAFAIKVVGEPGMAPEPFTVKVALGGSARDGQDSTEVIAIVDHAEDFSDGRWHDVSLPLSAMLRGKGAGFDTYRAWSFTIGAWNQGERKYEIFVDDVRFR